MSTHTPIDDRETADGNVTTKNDIAPQTKNAGIVDALRSHTRGEHRKVEAITFNEKIMREAIDRDDYVNLLACQLVIHEALEETLARHPDPRIAAVFHTDQIKADLIEADIEWCTDRESTPVSLRRDALRRARQLGRTIQWLADDDAACAIGFFYVFEGSTMGGMVLRKKIAAALGLEEDGLRFYTGYGRETAMRWRQSCQRLDSLELSDAEVGRAIAAANLAFLEIGHILAAL